MYLVLVLMLHSFYVLNVLRSGKTLLTDLLACWPLLV